MHRIPPRSARAVAYIRVSKEREEMISPENQLFAIQELARRKGLDVVKVFQDLDESGRTFEKRAIKQIIEAIRAGEYSTILLWKWSRWGRNVEHSKAYLAGVRDAGGRVESATEDIDQDTSTGRFTLNLLLALAELESDQKSETWKEAHNNRRRRGLPHTTRPYFGYTYDKSSGYSVDPETGPYLREAYIRYIDGASMYSLVQWFNSEGLRTISGRSWNTTNLPRQMDTGFGAGLIRERSQPPTASNNRRTRASFDVWRVGAHEPLIDSDQWSAYIRRRDVCARAPRLARATHALSGLVTCGACEGRMVSAYSGRHSKHSWVCPKGTNASGDCPGVSLSNRRLERSLVAWIAEQASEPPADMKVRIERQQSEAASAVDQAGLQATVDKIRTARSRLGVLFETGRIATLDEFDDRDREYAAQLAAAEDALRSAKDVVRIDLQQMQTAFAGLSEHWADFSPEYRNRILRQVVRRVIVLPGPYVQGKAQVMTMTAQLEPLPAPARKAGTLV